MGVAFEVTPGTYVAPAKYIPILNENLKVNEDTQIRRPIRESADAIGAVAGNENPDGDVNMEALEDCVLYFLHAARATVVKSGATNFTYTYTPSSAALPPNKTLSCTVKRSGQIFGYVGCTVGQFRFTVNNGVLGFGVTIVARNEASQSSPSATWPTTAPFGAGMYSIEIPTATPVTDVDTFEWTCNDNAVPEFRLKSTSRGADFVHFGERELGITLGRDFQTRADYDLFKSVTAQSITLTATKGANNSISLVTPSTIKKTYEVGLSGQGDLLRAAIQYQPLLGSPAAYQIIVKSQEDIT